MKTILQAACRIGACCAFAIPAAAALNVFACEPEWGALAQELGGDKVNVYQRDHRAAGSASHRSASEPDRARAQRRSADLLRLRAGNRLAAAAAHAVGQQPDPARLARLPRGVAVRRQAGDSEGGRSRARRHSSGRQSAHPSRSAQHREGRGGARRAGWRRSITPMRAEYRKRADAFRQRWDAAMQALGEAGGAAEERAARCVP